MNKVAVLLATYNGEHWLDEQIQTIVDQERVAVRIVASDDFSSDNTVAVLESCKKKGVVSFLRLPHRMGNANRNFLHLVCNADVSDCHYVALADQDDIWVSTKLNRAIAYLNQHDLDAYSSDVLAFWPNGASKRLGKAGAQKRYDHLFEAPGPGCTFVFPTETFMRLRDWVRANYRHLLDAPVHDWLIYAFFREAGLRWGIDPEVGLRYRQHGGNETGANVGLRAAARRLRLLRSGEFRRRVLWIADAAGHRSRMIERLRSFSVPDRLWLAAHALQMRRSGRDALMLAASFLFTKRQDAEG